MVLRDVFIATVFATSLVWCGLCAAEEYRADEFLGLDLSKAVLSPKPLGPAAGFKAGPLHVTVERESHRAQAIAEPAAEPGGAGLLQARAQKPRVLASTKIAHRQRNLLDAQASGARIQVWPCKSGGICNWTR